MCRDTEVNGRGWEGKHFQHRLRKRKTEGVKKSHGPSRAVKTARELQNYRLSGNIVSLQDQPELVLQCSCDFTDTSLSRQALFLMRLEIPLPFFSLTCHYYIKQTWDPASEARIQLRASLQNLHLSCCVHFCYKTKILSSGRLSVFAWRNALTLCNLKKRRKFMSKSVLNLFPLMFSPCIIDCINCKCILNT